MQAVLPQRLAVDEGFGPYAFVGCLRRGDSCFPMFEGVVAGFSVTVRGFYVFDPA